LSGDKRVPFGVDFSMMNSFVEPSSKLTGKCELRVGRQTADSNSTSSSLRAWCQLDSSIAKEEGLPAWRVASPGAGSWGAGELGCLGMGIWTWGREEEGGTPGPARWARINRRLHQGLLEMALPA
jgi:hypothetical protein